MIHPPGLVIILHGTLARYTAAEIAMQGVLLQLQRIAPGSHVAHGVGQWLGVSINQCLQAMQPEHAWACILADDHEMAPDMLDRLLAHQVDVVAPLVCLRSPPFRYSLFHEDAPGHYTAYSHAELHGKTGLVEIETMGGPGCVIRREVIERVGMPFFQCDPRSCESPKEDLYTFSRIRQAGFKMYVDTDTVITHCGVGSVIPHRFPDGRYGVTFTFMGMEIGSFLLEELPAAVTVIEDDYHAVT